MFSFLKRIAAGQNPALHIVLKNEPAILNILSHFVCRIYLLHSCFQAVSAYFCSRPEARSKLTGFADNSKKYYRYYSRHAFAMVALSAAWSCTGRQPAGPYQQTKKRKAVADWRAECGRLWQFAPSPQQGLV